MSWENISREIAEEFGSFAGKGSRDGFRDAWDFDPKLDEEVDMQEWHNHILLSRPSFTDKGGTPQTCVRVMAKKWKNGHGEGKWFAAMPSNSWGDQDYAAMSESCPIDIWGDPIPARPRCEIEAEVAVAAEPLPEPVIEPEPETVIVDLPPLPETKRVRIQVTMREGGQYVAGRNGNFQVSGADGERVVEILRHLEVLWPKCVKPRCSVRVQIQNLIGGKMSGGGNYQLHNADVPAVLTEIGSLVSAAGLTVEKRSGQEAAEVSKEVPKAKPEGVSRVWSEWKDSKDSKTCPDCGCGEVGTCLCKAIAQALR